MAFDYKNFNLKPLTIDTDRYCYFIFIPLNVKKIAVAMKKKVVNGHFRTSVAVELDLGTAEHAHAAKYRNYVSD